MSNACDTEPEVPRHRLETALVAVLGLAHTLLEMGKSRDNEAAAYLGGQLLDHRQIQQG